MVRFSMGFEECKIFGNGIDGYKYKKNITINAKNSGTLGRLILGFLINTPNQITLIGDKGRFDEILFQEFPLSSLTYTCGSKLFNL